MPAFNEQARIESALSRLDELSSGWGLRLEVIIADDGSTDATLEKAGQWVAAASPSAMQVAFVRIAHRGKGAAVRAGMQHPGTAPIVGYCDVDLSAGEKALAELLEAVRDGWDVAIASRGLPESVLEVRQPWYREASGRLFNLLLRKVTGIEYRDTQCGLKLFNRDAAREIFKRQRIEGFAFDAEVVLLADRLGYRVKEIPVHWAHDEGSKFSFIRDGTRAVRDIVRVVRRVRRGDVHSAGVPAAAAIDQMATSEDKHWWYRAKRLLVGKMVRSESIGGKCLDIGCGGGAMLLEAGDFSQAVGVDLSSEALMHAQSKGLRSLVKSEAARLPFARGIFDAAFALDVVEHHPRPELLLAETRRVLSPDGVLVVTVPAFRWMWSYADHVLGHYRRYTKSELGAEIAGAGFDQVRLTYFHSWLLPIAWLFRKLRALLGSTGSADDFSLPAPLNEFFLGISKAELAYLTKRNLPFGLSVLAVARPRRSESSSGVDAAAQDAGVRA